MAAVPVKFFFGFMLVSVVFWAAFIFIAKLVAWFLSRVVGASVKLRFGGWKCIRDITVKFNKGAIESIYVGEVRLSLRQSLVKLGFGFISRDPKLQVLLCDIEIVIRSRSKTSKKNKPWKSRGPGSGMWMLVMKMARFISLSVSDLVVKMPKATFECKEFSFDVSKDSCSSQCLLLRLNLLPFIVYIGESRPIGDHSSGFNYGGSTSKALESFERPSPPFRCDSICVSCRFGHDRDVGLVFKDLEIVGGQVMLNLNEELLGKRNTSSQLINNRDPAAVSGATSVKPDKNVAVTAVTKYVTMFPEKVCFSLPKVDLMVAYEAQNLFLQNDIKGIQLRTTRSVSTEDVTDNTRIDVQIEFSEIHLLREDSASILEVLKVDVVSAVYFPIQLSFPFRVEMDIKLGGTQCNIMISRLKPLLSLNFTKKKNVALLEHAPRPQLPQTSISDVIAWACTASAPEMTVVLYNMSNMPIYHGCSQSSHFFANNISSSGTEMHMEFGEINVHMADDYEESLKESLFGVETTTYTLMHVAKIGLGCGKKDLEYGEENHVVGESALVMDVSGASFYFTLKRLSSLLSTTMIFKSLSNSFSGSVRRAAVKRGYASKSVKKGNKLLKLNLERCSISFYGHAGLENMDIADPKKVNYGSQGGQVVVTTTPDGTLRNANIMSTVSGGCRNMSYTLTLDVYHFSMCVNKEHNSTKIELERARCNYHEHPEGGIAVKVTLFDIQNAKLVRGSGGLKGAPICSYFSALDIALRWEPDVHLSLFEAFLNLKSFIHNMEFQSLNDDCRALVSHTGEAEMGKENVSDTCRSDKRKKAESIFAVDVEILTISAELGDGVDAMMQVQSIFSENVCIGVLLEGLILGFNGAQVLRSSRMQISCIPSLNSSSDAKLLAKNTRDLVIQGLDIQLRMPFRLQLRAIEDSIEDMLRGLRLITSAKRKLVCPTKRESSSSKKSGTVKFGCLKFCISKLTTEIEEEPIQGWLDEHYQLLKNEACELTLRLKYLDDIISKACQNSEAEISDSLETKFSCNGIDVDCKDPYTIHKVRDEIYRQSFRSYYLACQKIEASEGSGACRNGFQAGFKPSTTRTSLLSICATELEVCLEKIEDGDAGIIEVLKRLDPVSKDFDIPFSRLYGSNVTFEAGTLAVQLRDYPSLFSGTHGKCQGCVVLAQQATCFQHQSFHEVFIGRWRKIHMLRSTSGTTPPMKTYLDLQLSFQKTEISFGVGYEPSFADVSYAFTVALRRANLSVRNVAEVTQPPKKEKSLPWWDDVRYYIHGRVILYFLETQWNILATTDPYEKLDKLQLFSNHMEISQSDGTVCVSAVDFKIFVSSLECLVKNRSLKSPSLASGPILVVPAFSLDIVMDWECDSGNPLHHYLHALPIEGKPREKVYDPFRSTSLSLRWNFLLRPCLPSSKASSSATQNLKTLDGDVDDNINRSVKSPILKVGSHDIAWIFKFWNMNYLPPHKLRTFSRWPRYGIPRFLRSGNLSLDKVMTEFMLRIDASPSCISHVPLHDDDPAKGLLFEMSKLKFELYYSRGKQKYTFESKRDPLDLVYQGLDLHLPKAFVDKYKSPDIAEAVPLGKICQASSVDNASNEKCICTNGCSEKLADDGFLFSSDYFTIRRQAPKADPARLLAWQEAGKNLEITYSRYGNGSDSDEHIKSDLSDDDGYNVVIADNCQRVFIYGLKLLWTIENRDAVWSWVGGISRALEPPKPSPSRQYAQRKILEETQVMDISEFHEDKSAKLPSTGHDTPFVEQVDALGSKFTSNAEEDGTRHFMVNVIEPQFNLHSEDANGRFLLAAVSGRVLARSFHSVLHVGQEVIERLGNGAIKIPESDPEMTWKRMEFSAMLEHVQAHVAPTDVDPGAGLQWLPKILRSSPKVKRTGALLERVFMPCDMYFRYTRHKGGTTDLKVKPLKELTFNSQNITATMTSGQFQVLLDVLTNLLFARLPKPQRSSLAYSTEDDSDVEEEADEVVPSGVEEVELARVNLEQKEQALKLLLDDIRKLSSCDDLSSGSHIEEENVLLMITGQREILVQRLKQEVGSAQKARKVASASLRMALQKAAHMRLMEKEKNKSPSYAMRISVKINTVMWGMLVDGKPFAESEINDMTYDFERDYKDIGLARFTTKSFVVRNCLPNVKSDMLLSAWNPPPEWGKKVMLRVDSKQGAPKDGNSPLELFQVEIYPLKIHLTEAMYRMMWEYFFPEEEQDSQRRQEVWKVSTTAGAKRTKKGASIHEASYSATQSIKEPEVLQKPNSSLPSGNNMPSNCDSSRGSKLQNLKANMVCGSTPELRRTSSFDRTWEENVAETVAHELVLHAHSKPCSLPCAEQQDEQGKSKAREVKPKLNRSSHEEKKLAKVQDDKRSRPRKTMEFHNIKISQVELLVTYEGSRFAVSDLRLLMDTFHRTEFTGTWRRLFSRVKKHIIWGVLKSVTGMQGKKFKDKSHSQKEYTGPEIPDIDVHFSDSDGGPAGNGDPYPLSWAKRPNDGAGDGFVTSIRGLFNSQRRKAKAFVLRTMRGEAESEFHGEWSESDAEFSPFARQLTITKARKLIRRHTKKFRSRGHRASLQHKESIPSTSRENAPIGSDSSSESCTYDDDHKGLIESDL